MADLPLELFRRFFAPSMRVRLDWDRLMKSPCHVQVTVIENLAEIAGWKMPWHFDQSGCEGRYDSEGARPISLCDTGVHINKMNKQRRFLIDRLIAAYQSDQHPVAFVAPTYFIEPTASLILDANHRLAAAYLAKVPLRVMNFAIHGPIDPQIIPDLKHWIRS